MGYLKYVRKVWEQPRENLGQLWKERQILWRKEPVTVRIEHPTRIDRARSLGYKAKPGYIIARQRLERGGKMRPDIKGGRRPARSYQRKVLRLNYQRIAEERCQKKFPNLEVLNSYWVGKDGVHYWFEVLLIDPQSPDIKSDDRIAWIRGHRDRVGRGLTAAGKRARGLLCKGKGAEKIRPSRRANLRLH